METDGGGWTVFLNRQKQTTQENFKRNWQEYKNGFGTPPYEFWMGKCYYRDYSYAKQFFLTNFGKLIQKYNNNMK